MKYWNQQLTCSAAWAFLVTAAFFPASTLMLCSRAFLSFSSSYSSSSFSSSSSSSSSSAELFKSVSNRSYKEFIIKLFFNVDSLVLRNVLFLLQLLFSLLLLLSYEVWLFSAPHLHFPPHLRFLLLSSDLNENNYKKKKKNFLERVN